VGGCDGGDLGVPAAGGLVDVLADVNHQGLVFLRCVSQWCHSPGASTPAQWQMWQNTSKLCRGPVPHAGQPMVIPLEQDGEDDDESDDAADSSDDKHAGVPFPGSSDDGSTAGRLSG
jgi:hypothetical protein